MMRASSERQRCATAKIGGEVKMPKEVVQWHRFRVGLTACFVVALGLASAISVVTAVSQSVYPNRPIRIVVGFAAGGPSDIISRVVGEIGRASCRASVWITVVA